MIKPYTAVGLIPTVRGIRKRKDIKINLEHLDRKSTRLNSSHIQKSRMPSSA